MLFHPFGDTKGQFCRIFELDISPRGCNRIKCKAYSILSHFWVPGALSVGFEESLFNLWLCISNLQSISS